jgi:V-type H+-transporting ATPase subunit a
MFWDGAMIRDRIQKICDSFTGDRFNVSQNKMENNTALNEVKEKIVKAKSVVVNTRIALRSQLEKFDNVEGDNEAGLDKASTIYIYKMFMAREKAMFKTLNMMEQMESKFIGYFWAPFDEESTIKDQLTEVSAAQFLRMNDHPKISPPTYIKTNDFTDVFQYAINTYGIPRYTEANPALLSCVTFPFLFGMMY